MKFKRLSIWGELTHENIEIMPPSRAPWYIPELFNNDHFVFKCAEGTHYTYKKAVTLVEIRKQRRIPAYAISTKIISLADSVTFSPAHIILGANWEEARVPDLFGKDQLAFIANDILYISQEKHVMQIQI